jgi:cell division control protein 7
MATTLRKRRHEAFEIHEDEPQVPSAADTEMQEDEVDQAEEEEEEPEANSQSSEDDSDDEALVDDVQEDMLKIEKHFKGFKGKFRLIKRIGEGTSLATSCRGSSPD